MAVMLGVRWDDPMQNPRIEMARDRSLIDYTEVNYPIPFAANPAALGLPILAHTSSNPTCSVHGINPAVARFVRDGAAAAESPWVGEHLTWLGTASTGSLGYQINPLFTPEFRDVAAANVRRLKDYYGRPVALELGPIYVGATGYESELHFLADVAEAADALIILDVTHWQIANLNLGRDENYGIDALPADRIVELHVAGMRLGSDGFWHDSHHDTPSDSVLAHVARLVGGLPALRAVTFEHHAKAGEPEFLATLDHLNSILAGRRPGATVH